MYSYSTSSTVNNFPPLSNFRCKAVVDWLDVSISVKNSTNFQTIQKALQTIQGAERKRWVEAVVKGPGGAAKDFVIRLHDPQNFQSLNVLFKALEERFPFSSPPNVAAIEVAVDFYSKSNDRSELLGMTARLMHETTNDGNNPRQFVTKTKKGVSIMRKLVVDDCCEYIDPRNTYYSGTKDVDLIERRIYHKVTDHNQMPIPDITQHRARTETKLRGEELKEYVTSLASLSGCQFQSLAKKFTCRAFVPPEVSEHLSPMERVLAIRERKVLTDASRVGHCALWKAKRRKFSQHSRADIELNTMIRESLRGLTQRFNTKKRWKKQTESVVFPLESGSALITANTVVPTHSSSSPPVAPV